MHVVDGPRGGDDRFENDRSLRAELARGLGVGGIHALEQLRDGHASDTGKEDRAVARIAGPVVCPGPAGYPVQNSAGGPGTTGTRGDLRSQLVETRRVRRSLYHRFGNV